MTGSSSWTVLAVGGAAPLEPPVPLLAPFLLILLAIAVMPFVHQLWWERNYHVVALALGAITVAYYSSHPGGAVRMQHVAQEYVGFMALIGSLYVVAGGIHIAVKGEAKPLANALFLLAGALLANVIGTTGASMLLIRPWIRMNKYRVTAFHIVFFIFLVSNVGGCLTPIGDPPLFLGFLKGVPFFWVVRTCILPWLVAVTLLTGIFYVLDLRNFRRAPQNVRDELTGPTRWSMRGAHNFVFLVLIVGAVFTSSPIREIIMAGAALGSWFSTSRELHEANDFNFHPIKEVAWLFLGIFATMVPALDYLRLHAGMLHLHSPAQFYWATGVMSGFLDNAPTYLTMLATALGSHAWSVDQPAEVRQFVSEQGAQLAAISLGAVFFGGLTYIGNGPNFMVKAMADHARVKMPGFFGYVLRYALPWLVPVLAIIALLFL